MVNHTRLIEAMRGIKSPRMLAQCFGLIQQARTQADVFTLTLGFEHAWDDLFDAALARLIGHDDLPVYVSMWFKENGVK